MNTVSAAVSQAAATLADAGVASPLFDAQLLAAHALGCDRMELFLRSQDPMPEEYQELISRRAARVPLQHITGTAPMGHLDLAVGPGVFIPRPETELLGDWAVRWLRKQPASNDNRPKVLDLCTGSGALALYVATLVPQAEVTAVELDEVAAEWTRKNIARYAPDVELVLADASAPDVLVGRSFDVVITNPPYVPSVAEVSPEVQQDPYHAVFSGESGMDFISAVAPNIVRWLNDGGAVGIEHDDSTATAVQDVLAKTAAFSQIKSHKDLAGRDRFVTAIRCATLRTE
ncbi:peptide chain release factor N(5)-glutamine methyltransferase [Staphylococcus chromogenes]|nr:peptide chain release factor N(5)-glutamine methyltransferase [Staphylococcus chromogenes]